MPAARRYFHVRAWILIVLLAGCTTPEPMPQQGLQPGDAIGVATAHANGTIPVGHPLLCETETKAPVPVDHVVGVWPLLAEGLPAGVEYEFQNVTLEIIPTNATNLEVHLALSQDGDQVASARVNTATGTQEVVFLERLDPGEYDIAVWACLGVELGFRLEGRADAVLTQVPEGMVLHVQ